MSCAKPLFYSLLILVMFITFSGCSKDPTGNKDSEARWKLIPELGEQRITELYVDSGKNKLCFTTENFYGIINQGSVSPSVLEPLHNDPSDCIRYVPFINDEYYIYCNLAGDILYIGDSKTGEFHDSIGIEEIVDEVDLPAKFSPSSHNYFPNHLVYHDDLYMLSIRHSSRSSDDWLYFGNFNFTEGNASFETAEKIASYAEPGTTTIYVQANYYYGGYFWQFRDDSFHPNICAVNEGDFSTVHTHFNSFIRSVYEYDYFLIGFFDIPVKRSYDGGFTWEEWIELNAPWNHEIINDVDVVFFSHNLGSIDFDLLEASNYDNGELHGNCIIDLEEFDGKVFAATTNGFFYCDLEDFFVPKPDDHNRTEGDIDLKITKLN